MLCFSIIVCRPNYVTKVKKKPEDIEGNLSSSLY